MFLRRFSKATGLVLLCVLAAGCATTDDQLMGTVTHTYKIVRKLEDDLGSTVKQLNETAADLSARVDESDRETRRLLGLVEENQHKLETLGDDLSRLTQTLYQHLGLTPPTPSSIPTQPPQGVMPGETQIEGGFEAPSASEPFESSEPPAETNVTVVETQATDADLAFRQAKRAYDAKDYDSAFKGFDQFLLRFPTASAAPDAQFYKADSCYRIGHESQDTEVLEKAVREYEKLRVDYPSSSKVSYAMFNQAAAHFDLKQSQEAIRLLRQLVEHFPTTPAGRTAKAKLEELGNSQ